MLVPPPFLFLPLLFLLVLLFHTFVPSPQWQHPLTFIQELLKHASVAFPLLNLLKHANLAFLLLLCSICCSLLIAFPYPIITPFYLTFTILVITPFYFHLLNNWNPLIFMLFKTLILGQSSFNLIVSKVVTSHQISLYFVKSSTRAIVLVLPFWMIS